MMDPVAFPTQYIETVTLEGGRQVTLRPIRPADAPLLQQGIKRLSPESLYMRFFEVTSSMSDEEALELATVDYHDRMAFVGEIKGNRRRMLISVARYEVIPGSNPRTAEAAIVVGDEFQSKGLGKLSMDRLIRYALEHGIKVFAGAMHTNNQRILNFVAKSGLPFERNMLEPGVWEYKIYLDPEAAPESATRR